MSISAGSRIGPLHVNAGTVNQDSFSEMEQDGITVIAVADGAGSLPKSEIGAQLASMSVVQEVFDLLQCGSHFDTAVRDAITNTRSVLMLRDDVQEIGCTLAVAAFSKNGWGAGVVGDAFIVVAHEDGSHELVRPESTDEFVNVTTFLTSKNFDPLIVSGDEAPRAVAACSDGMAGVSLAGNEPSKGFWTPLFKHAEEEPLDVNAFLEYMDKAEKISDDTTLVIATRD